MEKENDQLNKALLLLLEKGQEGGNKAVEVNFEKPWGGYITYLRTEKGALKTIHVKPLARLSDQRHFKRSEKWWIISGEAKVELEYLEAGQAIKQAYRLKRGESVEIPLGAWHRLENPSDKKGLIVLEITAGTHEEEDIERRADDYGRV